MRLTVVTPLFPPDVHDVATYHKDLVARLAQDHQVAVALFGHLPENVPGVLFHPIDKRTKVGARLWQMFRTLRTLRTTSDWFIVTNGPSTELPALILSFFTRTPILLLSSDTIQATGFYHFIHTQLSKRARVTISSADKLATLTRPEIHHFISISATTLSDYETAWTMHIREINHHLNNDTHH